MREIRKSLYRRMFAALAIVLSLAAGTASAGTSELKVLLDLDDNAATGCTVATVDGPFAGADEVLTVTVVANLGVASVTAQARQTCVGGVLSPASPVTAPFAPPWPVGLGLGTGGAGVVEAYLPLTGSQAPNVRVAFISEVVAGGSGADALLTTNGGGGGNPIYLYLGGTRTIPTLSQWGLLALATLLVALGASLIRRRLPATLVIAGTLILGLGVGMAWAAITLDGGPGDWSTPAAANDATGDAPAGADIVAAFGQDEYVGGAAVLFVRLDVVFNDPPIARDDAFTIFEDAQATGNVLVDNGSGADSDPNSDPLAIDTTPASGPDFGGVILSANGAFTYTPPLNFTGTATFDYELLDDQGGSDLGTVSITVNPVNDVPSFTKGADDAVGKNSGARSIAGWATAILPGPSDESGQSVSFIVSNDNNALFAVQPAVSPTGTLTYTPAANTTGAATVSVQIHDDGGIANGGVDTSAVQTVAVSVFDVNTAPSFTKGPDQTVDEDAGAQTVPTWATAISKGSPDESGQTVDFIVSNDSNALFSVQPAVSPTGTLTYTPAGNATGSATVSVQIHDNGGTANGGVDTSAVQTFTITVDPVNDPPSFTKGADDSVLEDSGARTVPGWATSISPGPADEAGQTVAFNVTGNTNPGLFAVAPAVAANGTLTYTPAGDANGVATITLEAADDGGTANGGDDTSAPQTFDITVSGVNDEPSFAKGSDQSVYEDAGAQSVAGWATTISPGPANESGQTVSFIVTGNTNPGLFAAGPAVASNGALTYTSAADANGSATITIEAQDDGGTANGGDDTSPSQAFVITVNAVNDEPSFAKGADETPLEDSGAHTVPNWATSISPGPADEFGQAVSFTVTGNTNAALFSAGPAIGATGTLTYTLAPDRSGSATITVEARDDGGTANGGDDTSASQTFVISVTDVNDEPSFTKGVDQTVSEDAGAQTVLNWATAIAPGPADEAGQTVSFNITGNTNSALFSAGPAVGTTGALTFTPAPDAHGAATITLEAQDTGGTANGGDDTSPPQTFVITVDAVNDEPSFTKGADQTVNEDAGAQTVINWATAISPGPADEAGQSVSFNVTGNTDPGLFSAAPAVSSAGTLTYTPATDASGSATITVEAQDDGGTANGGDDTSTAQTFVITVTGVNDAPSFSKGADPSASEDAGPQSVAGWATAISPGPADEAGQTVSFNVTGNTNAGLFSAGPAVSSTGTLTFTSSPNAFGSATITLEAQDNGGTANGGIDTSPTQSFTITIIPVNDPPLAGADAWDTVGNTELRVDLADVATPRVLDTTASTLGVLHNDSDPVEGDALAVSGVVGCADATAPFGDSPTCATVNGGRVVVEANGRFSFVPKEGDSLASDSFQYTVADNGIPAPASANGTVTISRYERVWYVRNNGGPGGLGRSTDPFDTLAEAQTASSANDYIFVNFGDGTSTGQAAGITLKAGQHLIGEHHGLSIPVDLNGNGNPQTLYAAVPGNRPLIDNNGAGNNAVSATDVIPVEIVGLSLQGAANAVDLTLNGAFAASGTLSLRNNVVRGAGAEGIEVNSGGTGTLTLTVTGNSWSAGGTHTGNAVDIARTNGSLRLDFSNNTGILSSATAVNIAGGAAASTTITGFANNIVHQSTVGSGMSVSNATFDATPGGGYNTVTGGTTTVGVVGDGVGGAAMALSTVAGDLSFTDLDLYGGSGLSLSGTGAVNVGAGTGMRLTVGAGVATMNATAGPAVDVSGATVDLQLAGLTSSASGSTGISLVSIADGTTQATFSAPSGSSISNATGTAFNLDGGNATVSYAGTINNGAGRAVVVQNRTADTATFSGNITDTGTGILLNNNTGSTTNFSGQISLTTGANAAFTATGGGTVTATGSPSTITTTTATALNVANTTIGASGLTFRSISAGTGASGPTNGIVLNTTGSSGGLTVTGTGSAGTGGTIQRCSGPGILLTSTSSVNLSYITVSNGSDDGIRGTTVTGLSLTGVQVTANGNAAGEAGIDLAGLLGTSTWSGITVSGSAEDNVVIRNSSGTLNGLTVTSSTFSGNSPLGNDGFLVDATATAAMTVSVTGSTFSANRGDHFQAAAANSGILDVVFSGNTLSGGHATPLGQGITISAATGVPGYSGTVDYNIDNNSINGAIVSAITANLGTSAAGANMRGTISGNIIGTLGSFQSGSTQASGITVEAHGNGTHTTSVTNNTIRQTFDRGINVLANDGGGALNMTVTGNNASHSDGVNSREGFFINNGSADPNIFGSADSHFVCLTLGGAGALRNTLTHGPGAPDDFRLRQRFSSTVRLPGYVGGATDTAAVVTFVNGNNTSATGSATVNSPPGGGFVGGAACPIAP